MTRTILTPDHYPCPQHGHDLTGAVLEKVTAEPTLVTNLGFRRSGRPAGAETAFEVVVTCPGDGGHAGAHRSKFRGTYRDAVVGRDVDDQDRP
jgi:hypothetical protein